MSDNIKNMAKLILIEATRAVFEAKFVLSGGGKAHRSAPTLLFEIIWAFWALALAESHA
jgi:hypothetical protein